MELFLPIKRKFWVAANDERPNITMEKLSEVLPMLVSLKEIALKFDE